MKIFKLNKSLGLLWIGLFFTVITSCADRTNKNPLDPENPNTGGKLTGLEVVSFDGIVFLSWDEINIDDYVGTKILRSSSLDSGFNEIALVAGTVNRYDDVNTVFDVTYKYKIQAITSSFESPLSDEVFITPGPSRVWVNIATSGVLFQLTHDASHVLFSKNNSFFDISAIATISNGNGVWISDFTTKKITKLTLNGEELISFIIEDAPTDLDFDSSRERLWFLVQDSSKVVFGNTDGEFRIINIGFSQPTAISTDISSGICWVTDISAKTITNIDLSDSSAFLIEDLDQPEDVAAYYKDGSIWVADVSSVKHFDSGGDLQISVGNFNFVHQVSVNQETGTCWAIDLQSGINNSQIVKIAIDGSIEFRLDGFTNPLSIDVDEYDGSCLVADTGNFRVVRISKDGIIKGEWQAIGAPNLVRVSSP